jgi:hypothetical protein
MDARIFGKSSDSRQGYEFRNRCLTLPRLVDAIALASVSEGAQQRQPFWGECGRRGIALNDKLNLLLRQLRNLDKAYSKMIRAVPDPPTAERNADNALEAVLNLLEDPELGNLIEKHIPPARDQIATEAFDKELKSRHKEVTLVEIKLSQPFGLRRRDLQLMYEQYSKAKSEKARFVSSVDAIRQRLIKAHNAAKEEVAKSRELSRTGKKKRKRGVGQGIVSAVFGTVVIAANTQLPIVFAFSYGLGGGAIHQALRDIVGTNE